MNWLTYEPETSNPAATYIVMGVTAETSGGQQLMMRAHRRMPRGMGEWLAEGEGPNQVGCCFITTVEAVRGFVMVVRQIILTRWMQILRMKTHT